MLDTIKLSFPSAAIEDADFSRFGQTTTYDRETGQHVVAFRQNFRRPTGERRGRRAKGLDYGAFISFRPDLQNWILEMSAKCLGEQYVDGIHSGTIDRALGQIAAINGVKFSPGFGNYAQVLRADPAATVQAGADPIADVMMSLRAKLSWARKQTRNQSESSLLLHNTREELKIYDKERELQHSDPVLFELVRPRVEGAVRMEYTAKELQKLARRFGVARLRERVTSRVEPLPMQSLAGRPVSVEVETVQSSTVYLAEILDIQKQRSVLAGVWGELRRRPVGEVNGEKLLEEAAARGWPVSKMLRYAGAMQLWLAFEGDYDRLYATLKRFYHRASAHRTAKTVVDLVARLDPALMHSEAIFSRFDERVKWMLAA